MVGKFTCEFLKDFCQERKITEHPRDANMQDIVILTEMGNLILLHTEEERWGSKR